MNARMKTIDAMNYYEVLNIGTSSSQQEIEEAYAVSKQAFAEESLAHYGLVEPGERVETRKRIEEAYRTLGNPRKRKRYDVKILKLKAETYENAYFRNGLEPMVIEGDGDPPSRWGWLLRLFRRS
jgi:DnaJ-class molecular chaperone